VSLQILRGNLILPDRLLERGLLVIEDGLIGEVREGDTGDPTEDWGNCFIAPGFIDVHVHGIAGADTMDGGEGSLAAMAETLAHHGVTGFLPTTHTAPKDPVVKAIERVYLYMQRQEGLPGARVLGAHMEGPWIAKEFKGAQNERYIALPTKESVNDMLAFHGRQVIKVVSLAPELAGAEDAILTLRRNGIYVSLGHTGATYEQALHAVALGATHITHCFNAMKGLHHRHPGVVGAALILEQVFVELIADGVHVHPDVMRLLIRSKGREKIMLISDAIPAAGLPEGSYMFGGQEVCVHNGRACLKDGTLAGSTLTLDEAVRNIVRMCNMSIPDAVYMATAAPAEAMGLGEKKGKIRAGYDADIAILDQDLQPVEVLIAGEKQFGSGNEI